MSKKLASIIFICLCFGPAAIGQEQSTVVFRPSQDTAATKSSIQHAFSAIPSSIRDAVLGFGCKIVIVPTIAEYMGMGYADKPRGYNDGGGYDNAGGMFVPARNELLVAERVSYRNAPAVKQENYAYVIRHEFGHAYDYFLGKNYRQKWAASALTAFVNTHEREVSSATNSVRSSQAYFCQAEPGGASETFAELFCIHCESISERTNDQKELLSAFPATDQLVKSAMNSPQIVQDWDE